MPVREEQVCRFCLMPQENTNNRFITPCNCTGSVEYIHVDCFNRWRRVTEYEQHRRICQLCLTEYNLGRHWPIERMPRLDYSSAWFLLSRYYVFGILLYYAHFTICMKFLPIEMANTKSEQIINQLTGENGTHCFVILMGIVTAMYASFYWTLFRTVRNKLRYCMFLFRSDIQQYTHITPISYMLLLPFVYYVSQSYIYPFGWLYAYLLPQYMYVHVSILHTLNEEGEVHIVV